MTISNLYIYSGYGNIGLFGFNARIKANLKTLLKTFPRRNICISIDLHNNFFFAQREIIKKLLGTHQVIVSYNA